MYGSKNHVLKKIPFSALLWAHAILAYMAHRFPMPTRRQFESDKSWLSAAFPSFSFFSRGWDQSQGRTWGRKCSQHGLVKCRAKSWANNHTWTNLRLSTSKLGVKMPNHMRVVRTERNNLWKLPNTVPDTSHAVKLVLFTPHLWMLSPEVCPSSHGLLLYGTLCPDLHYNNG